MKFFWPLRRRVESTDLSSCQNLADKKVPLTKEQKIKILDQATLLSEALIHDNAKSFKGEKAYKIIISVAYSNYPDAIECLFSHKRFTNRNVPQILRHIKIWPYPALDLIEPQKKIDLIEELSKSPEPLVQLTVAFYLNDFYHLCPATHDKPSRFGKIAATLLQSADRTVVWTAHYNMLDILTESKQEKQAEILWQLPEKTKAEFTKKLIEIDRPLQAVKPKRKHKKHRSPS